MNRDLDSLLRTLGHPSQEVIARRKARHRLIDALTIALLVLGIIAGLAGWKGSLALLAIAAAGYFYRVQNKENGFYALLFVLSLVFIVVAVASYL